MTNRRRTSTPLARRRKRRRKRKSFKTPSLIKDPFKRRLTAICTVFLLISVALLARSIQVQILGDTKLKRLSNSQFKKKLLVTPRRGVIYDRSGKALAVNTDTKSLAANPKLLRKKGKSLKKVARLLSKALKKTDAAWVYKRIKAKKNFVWIKRHIEELELARLAQAGLTDSSGDLIDGLWLVRETKRVYPFGEVAAQTLGSVNVDSDGIEGVELWFNPRLRGEVVSVDAVKDALGRPTLIDAAAAEKVKDGEPVSLTLDASLQFSVEQNLKDWMEETKSRSGTAIVMDAVSGEILALASRPTFNPNFRKDSPHSRRNRAITDGFEPGSTIKPLLMAGALKNDWNPKELIWGGQGSMKIGKHRITEAEAKEKFGWLTIDKVVKVSSNVGAAKVALKLGQKKTLRFFRELGFGVETGIGFPGEITGWLPKKKRMAPITLANLGFGQGLFATPIQMVRAYAAILNGGWLIQPVLIKDPKVYDQDRKPQKIFSREISEKITRALLEVTKPESTGRRAALEGYKVAGKTGTAQVVDPKTRRYSTKRYIASFLGFIPNVDRKLVVFTALDYPKGNYYSSETAAPFFRDVLSSVVHRFGIPKTEKVAPKIAEKKKKPLKDSITTQASAPIPPDQIKTRLKPIGTNSKGKRIWMMPKLDGMTAREVLLAFEGSGIELDLRGYGVVTEQQPAPETHLMRGSKIRVVFSESDL